MLSFFKPKKRFIVNEKIKRRIEKEIDILSELNSGIYYKSKEFDIGYYINIIVDKRICEIEENDNLKIPDYIIFLIIVNSSYPDSPPHVLSKTNFSFPSLMDGRELINEIIPNWTRNSTLFELASNLPKFISKVVYSKIYNLYGFFHLGAIYDLKNFNNMSVNIFNCKIDMKNKQSNEYTLILSDDCFILLEKINVNLGKISFWSTLYSITDLQINKVQKIAVISFYNDEKISDKQIRLNIDNILLFKEALIKRMNNLKINIDSKNVIKGQKLERKLTDRDINIMSISNIVEYVNIFKRRINNGEINYYTINTFTQLCSKAIEFYSAINDDSHLNYLMFMKEVLCREEVQKVTNDNI